MDVVSNVSTFEYAEESLPPNYLLTKMTTPYGATSFDYFGASTELTTGADGSTNGVNRTLTITEATGAKQAYMYRDDSSSFLTYCYPNPPCGVPLLVDAGNPDCFCGFGTQNYDGLCNHNMYYRNSFYWGPRHYPLLSTTNLLLLSTNSCLLYTSPSPRD